MSHPAHSTLPMPAAQLSLFPSPLFSSPPFPSSLLNSNRLALVARLAARDFQLGVRFNSQTENKQKPSTVQPKTQEIRQEKDEKIPPPAAAQRPSAKARRFVDSHSAAVEIIAEPGKNQKIIVKTKIPSKQKKQENPLKEEKPEAPKSPEKAELPRPQPPPPSMALGSLFSSFLSELAEQKEMQENRRAPQAPANRPVEPAKEIPVAPEEKKKPAVQEIPREPTFLELSRSSILSNCDSLVSGVLDILLSDFVLELNKIEAAQREEAAKEKIAAHWKKVDELIEENARTEAALQSKLIIQDSGGSRKARQKAALAEIQRETEDEERRRERRARKSEKQMMEEINWEDRVDLRHSMPAGDSVRPVEEIPKPLEEPRTMKFFLPREFVDLLVGHTKESLVYRASVEFPTLRQSAFVSCPEEVRPLLLACGDWLCRRLVDEASEEFNALCENYVEKIIEAEWPENQRQE